MQRKGWAGEYAQTTPNGRCAFKRDSGSQTSLELVPSLRNLAKVLMQAGEPRESRLLFDRVLGIRQRTRRPEDPAAC